VIHFPPGLGITGSVAASGKIFTTDSVKKEQFYSAEIDNSCNIMNIE
jgi:hypothetical protein